MANEYVVMVDGIFHKGVLVAESLDDAQVLALRLCGNSPNVIAMTVQYAKQKYPMLVRGCGQCWFEDKMMTEKDFFICPQFNTVSAEAGAEPNLEQLIFNYYSRYYDGQQSLALTQKYIKTLLAMKDPAGVM